MSGQKLERSVAFWLSLTGVLAVHAVRTSCMGTPVRQICVRRPQSSVKTLAWFTFLLYTYYMKFITRLITIIPFAVTDVGDTGAEFDRVFLQELRDLKVFVNDRDIVEEHKR